MSNADPNVLTFSKMVLHKCSNIKYWWIKWTRTQNASRTKARVQRDTLNIHTKQKEKGKVNQLDLGNTKDQHSASIQLLG